MFNPKYFLLPVEAIANKILEISKKHKLEIPNNIKLNYLVYLCQGYSLGMRGHPLFEEPIEAWKIGPIIPKLYNQLKEFKLNPITIKLDTKCDILSDLPTGMFIESLMYRIGEYDILKLASLVKAKNSPWDMANENQVIPLWYMALYFLDNKLF